MSTRQLTEEEYRKIVLLVTSQFGHLQFRRVHNPEVHDWVNIHPENCAWDWEKWKYRIDPTAPFALKFISISGERLEGSTWIGTSGAYAAPFINGEFLDGAAWPTIATVVAVVFDDLTVREVFVL